MGKNLPRGNGGFTLVETVFVLAIAAVLASIAYPTYRGVVHKVRRSDALAALLKVQLAQERYRAERLTYGGLSDIGIASTTPGGYYSLTMASATSTGFEVLASARGAQSADMACRHLKLAVEGLDVRHASGPDTTATNQPTVNRQCWGV